MDGPYTDNFHAGIKALVNSSHSGYSRYRKTETMPDVKMVIKEGNLVEYYMTVEQRLRKKRLKKPSYLRSQDLTMLKVLGLVCVMSLISQGMILLKVVFKNQCTYLVIS